MAGRRCAVRTRAVRVRTVGIGQRGNGWPGSSATSAILTWGRVARG